MKSIIKQFFPALLLIFIISFNSQSQSVICENPFPTCYGLGGMFFVDSLNGFAVGNQGVIGRYNGNSWKKDEQQDKTTETLTDAFFLDKNTGWIVGQKGVILKYKDGTYTLQSSGITTNLNAVYFTDENNGWATGDYNLVLRYKNGTWTTEKTTDASNNNPLYDIHMYSQTLGWAVGYGGMVFNYNGTKWNKIANPTTETLYSVAFKDSTFGFAVGTSGTILKYNLNKTWTKVKGGFVYTLTNVNIVNNNSVWASGYYGSIINYNGTSWTDGNAQGPWYEGLSMINSKTGWVYTSDGLIHKLTNGVPLINNSAIRKTDYTPYTQSLSTAAISMQSNSEAWMLGTSGLLFQMKAGIWRQYKDALDNTVSYQSISVFNDTLGFAVGDKGTIYKFNGTDWKKVTTSFQSSISTSLLYKVFILDATHVYIVGTNGVFLRYGAGVWEKITVTNQTTTNFYDVQFLDANTGWLAGASGVIMKYKNGTFEKSTYTGTNSVVRVHFFDETEGWIISNADVIQYKNSAWTKINSALVLVRDFYFTDKNTGWLIGPPYYEGGAGGVMAKYSGGSWTRVPGVNFTQRFYGIDMVSANEGLVMGEYGLLLRIGTKAPVQEIIIPTAAFGYSPATPVTADSVSFQNNSQNGITYFWNFGEPASGVNNTSTKENPKHAYATEGTYLVQLTATNGEVSNTFSQSIIVKKAIVTDVNDPLNVQQTLVIYPNPVSDVLTIVSSQTYTNATITDLSGSLVKSAALTENAIDLSDLSQGCYILSITDQAGNVVKSKLLKN